MRTYIRSVPAATGAVFAIVLTIANGQGGTLSTPRSLAASVALTVFVAFAGYVGTLQRAATSAATDAWLASVAVAAGAVGAGLKLVSGVPDVALSQTSAIRPGDETAQALTAVASVTTVLALFPLALFCLAVGVGALRNRFLPRWLGVSAVVAGAGLAVNGCFLDTTNVPAMLLLALWCLVASLYLVVVEARRQPRADSARSRRAATIASGSSAE